jgi:hypothetical protein
MAKVTTKVTEGSHSVHAASAGGFETNRRRH